MKIVFFGTSENSVILLQGLAEKLNIAAVVTSPDATVGRKQILTESLVARFCHSSPALQNIPILKPTRLKDSGFLNQLQQLEADMFVVLSYGKILPLEVINMPRLKTINIHPSLLPKYRGATPMQSALLNGDNITGNSIIVMDEEMDHGPLLAQETVVIDPNQTYEELETKLAKLSIPLTLQVIEQYSSGQLQPIAQDHSQATYISMITKEDGKVNWNSNSQQIYNSYRAYKRWPGIWTTFNGQMLKILNCSVADESHHSSESSSELPTGTVVPGGRVACDNNSYLQLIEVQLAGKIPTDIKSFINGYPGFVGSLLS